MTAGTPAVLAIRSPETPTTLVVMPAEPPAAEPPATASPVVDAVVSAAAAAESATVGPEQFQPGVYGAFPNSQASLY
ncbi:hypothetical protein HK100_007694, partial [Physocladia obscura]